MYRPVIITMRSDHIVTSNTGHPPFVPAGIHRHRSSPYVPPIPHRPASQSRRRCPDTRDRTMTAGGDAITTGGHRLQERGRGLGDAISLTDKGKGTQRLISNAE
jgi:hypothetical protein